MIFAWRLKARHNIGDALVSTHFGKTLLGFSLTGGGLGLMDGSLTLAGGLLLRSLVSGLSSIKQIHHITPNHYLFLERMCHNNVMNIIKVTAPLYLSSLLGNLSPSLRPLSSLKKHQ